MKSFQTIIIFIIGAVLQGQTTVYPLEYNKSGTNMEGVGFNLEYCEKGVLKSFWKDWIKTRNGKVSLMKGIMGTQEAHDVQFNKQSYTTYFDVLENENKDSVTVVNVFKSATGAYINPDSNDLYEKFKETINDFAFQSKKACTRNELEQANKFQGKLNDDLLYLQRKKAKEEKNILNNQNNILNLENDIVNLGKKIVTLSEKMENTGAGKAYDKLNKKKQKAEYTLTKNEGKISDSENEIIDSENEIENLKNLIEQKLSEIDLQQNVISKIKLKLSNITP